LDFTKGSIFASGYYPATGFGGWGQLPVGFTAFFSNVAFVIKKKG
jgi:hypothetical protein